MCQRNFLHVFLSTFQLLGKLLKTKKKLFFFFLYILPLATSVELGTGHMEFTDYAGNRAEILRFPLQAQG